MSTRGAIGIQHGDQIKAIYSHYDNYPEHTGYILQNYYNDSVLVNKLISMGDMSSLGAEIGRAHSFDERSEYLEPAPGVHVATQCTFYNRDRGEETSWLSFPTAHEWTQEHGNWGCEYFYLFKNDQWYMKGRRGGWRLLSRVLSESDTL